MAEPVTSQDKADSESTSAESNPEGPSPESHSDQADSSSEPQTANNANEVEDRAVEDLDSAQGGVELQVPEFAALHEGAVGAGALPLDRFYEVSVNVWAELGRIELPIGQLLDLGEGSVVKLHRPVSDPVDLVAQGVRLARGEVVVIDDCFAIRIKEIESSGNEGLAETAANAT